jgi:hypothetical protein
VVELADTLDSKSSAPKGREGSSPSPATKVSVHGEMVILPDLDSGVSGSSPDALTMFDGAG